MYNCLLRTPRVLLALHLSFSSSTENIPTLYKYTCTHSLPVFGLLSNITHTLIPFLYYPPRISYLPSYRSIFHFHLPRHRIAEMQYRSSLRVVLAALAVGAMAQNATDSGSAPTDSGSAATESSAATTTVSLSPIQVSASKATTHRTPRINVLTQLF